MINKLFKHPLLNIIIILIITAIFAFGLTKISISNDVMNFLPETNKVYQDDQKIKKIYNTGEVMFIGIKSKSGNILTTDNLQTIDKITKAIDNIEVTKKDSKKSDKKADLQTQMDYSNMLETIEKGGNVDQGNTGITGRQIFDSVDSVTNIELIEGIDGGLSPVKLEKYVPTNEKELLLFKEKLLSWDMYEDTFYSKDFSSTSIIVTYAGECSEEDQALAYTEIKKVIDQNKNDDMEVHYAGKVVVKFILAEYIRKDLAVMVPLVTLIVLLVLALSFKNKRGVFLPLTAVLISVIWVMGIMGFLGIELTLIGTIIPILLIAIGSAYGIHVITHYMDDKKNLNKSIAKEENKELVKLVVKKVTFPVFLAALTTFFGFLSLLSVNMAPIKEFAILSGIGVMIEFVLSVIFIPSVIMLLRVQNKSNKYNQENNNTQSELPYFEKVLLKFVRFLKSKRIPVLIFMSILFIVFIYGATKLKIDFEILKYFRKDSDIVKSTKFINDNFSGADNVYVNIIGKEEGDLAKPEILKFMDNLGIYIINKHPMVGKVVGFNDMIKKMNQVMHYPDSKDYKKFLNTAITYEEFFKIINSTNVITGKANPEAMDIIKKINIKYNINGSSYYEIPLNPERYNITEDDAAVYAKEKNIDYTSLNNKEKNNIKKNILGRLISQYLVLYSGNMNELIAPDQIKPKTAKLTMTLKDANGNELRAIKKDIMEYAKKYIPDGYNIELGGTAMITNEMNSIIVLGQVSSFFISLLIIFTIVAISFKSFFAGLISIIPLATSILCNFAIMGFTGIELNLATALIASLTTGMGIDYAIHLLTFYKENWKIYHNVDKAIEMTFITSGKAIISNALSVGLGFAVLLFSSMVILGTFGFLITLTMITSAFGALLIIPIMLEMFKPKFVNK